MRIMLDVADISRFHPMLCHYPELISYMSITHWRPPWLSRLSSCRFEQRISRQRQTRYKRELNWRIQKIFLKSVDNPMFHFAIDRINFGLLFPTSVTSSSPLLPKSYAALALDLTWIS